MHPILYKIGPLTLHTYGALVAIGFMAGLFVAINQAKKQGIPKEKVLDLGFYILISAIVGSRLLYVIIESEYYIKHPLDIFKLWEGGLVFFGGLLLALPVVIVYLRKNALSFGKVADIFAPALAIGHAIGRLGCFSAGCCHGRPTTLPWGVVFTDPDSLAITGIPLHPTQLYEAFANLVIFFLLLLFQKRKRFDGQIVALYLGFYSAVRFTIEFFRGDSARGFFLDGISTSQGISLALFISAVSFLLYKRGLT